MGKRANTGKYDRHIEPNNKNKHTNTLHAQLDDRLPAHALLK